MTEPVIARLKPYFVQLKTGRPYTWCRCGRSSKQPFCDGAHEGTEFKPLRYVPEQDEERIFCACKHTRSPPFCDGSHNNLLDKYAEAEPDDHVDVTETGYGTFIDNVSQQARLDNGCYVLRRNPAALQRYGNLRIAPIISAATGAKHLAQYTVLVEQGTSPLMTFPGAEVVVFFSQGSGSIIISGKAFAMPLETGAYIRSGEVFSLGNESGELIDALITVCPGDAQLILPDSMPTDFDISQPERTRTYAEDKRETMADRFLQELINQQLGCEQVTQFIGEIPQSKAAYHRHLYEEVIYILSGSGMMWTDTVKAAVGPGDIIFLPAKQDHALECTSAEGMRLMGVFYPAGSPKVNY